MGSFIAIIFGSILTVFGVLFLSFLLSTTSFTRHTSLEVRKHRVILVVLDALRHDYLEIAKTRNIDLQNIDRMVTNGARIKQVIPVYPAVTFPNHQTMLTGLYSPYHGITHNNFNDSSMDFDQFSMDNQSSINEPRWYRGYPDPIWVTCEKEKYCKSGSMLFPNTDAVINGYRPSRYVSQYTPLNQKPNIVYPYDRRVDELLGWIKNDLIDFGLLYFDEPDATSHEYGPLDNKTFSKLLEMDGYIGRLLEGLEKEDLLQTTDVLLTGDHGMTEMSLSRVINIDDFVNKTWYKSTYSYPVGIIYPNEGRFDDVFMAYSNASKHIKVYRREGLPMDLYYTDNPRRISPIVTVVDQGWFVNCSHYNKQFLKGYHGNSPYDDDMKTMLIAMGPSFRQTKLNSSRHVDLYSLMTHILGVKANPHNGSFERISGMLSDQGRNFVPIGDKFQQNVVNRLVFTMTIAQILLCFCYVIASVVSVIRQQDSQSGFEVSFRKGDIS